eukprot:CAMPEP_0116895424 /NCGR_PEP_ID=MMETSP0467-20121206/4945_1 /TAXON_ID=283647 /ORGANISM="Mesodinium pulex, Strain SPMC105" /LENGTH=316 /DNA_ID=CAMNT_0004566135 /DNA_START=29 /DNA_END=979 /DNA_ORIENTATION=-
MAPKNQEATTVADSKVSTPSVSKDKKLASDESKESIFTSELFPSLYLTAGYLFLLRYMAQTLYTAADATPYSDPFKETWWSGPIFFTIAYLIMVYVGPKMMEKREPFDIKPYMFTYNLYQCVLNIWFVLAVIYEVYTNPMFTGVWGNYPENSARSFRISFLVWVHYNNKYVELLDTVFMILRKKNNQISFLHCYHHVMLIWAWFLVCKVEAGGDSFFGATVNSFIHVIMYGYYTLALMGISCPWKKWITKCQMLQFCLCLSHSVYTAWKGNAPIILPAAQAFVMINMLVLFGNFYKKAYKKDGEKSGKEDKKLKSN